MSVSLNVCLNWTKVLFIIHSETLPWLNSAYIANEITNGLDASGLHCGRYYSLVGNDLHTPHDIQDRYRCLEFLANCGIHNAYTVDCQTCSNKSYKPVQAEIYFILCGNGTNIPYRKTCATVKSYGDQLVVDSCTHQIDNSGRYKCLGRSVKYSALDAYNFNHYHCKCIQTAVTNPLELKSTS